MASYDLDSPLHFRGVCLPSKPPQSRFDVTVKGDRIDSIIPHDERISDTGKADSAHYLLAPSLCHPHFHMDKVFLMQWEKYAHLQPQEGTFQEAMDLTNKAKKAYSEDDLEARADSFISESLACGVTHMRAFVEVDPIVGHKCLIAGRQAKRKYESAKRCRVQLCAFAQLPLFSAEDGGEAIRRLMREATHADFEAEAIGSTPYVETDREKMEKNVEWLIDLALETDKHIDFHLDYNLDPATEPLIWHVIATLKSKQWTQRSKHTIVLGHCTRLTLFKDADWARLKTEIGDLPISFVGLPTSDLYMMKTDAGARGTLNVPSLIKDHGINAAISINNVGNAFTPYGSVDPLYLASLGVGVYQAGTQRDAELLYECMSTRAKAAIGVGERGGSGDGFGLEVQEGQAADLVLFGHDRDTPEWKWKRTVMDAVYYYDGSRGRKTVYHGGMIV